MVSFICDACGQTVKKSKVEKHYQTECRNCSVLSCIDCGKDFPGDEYAGHTSCISEAEKYQGKLYQPKEKANKGELKQQEWIKQVQQAGDGAQNPKLKGYLNKIQEYSNVPRKRAKFINFCKNSIRVFDQNVLDQLWEAFNPMKNKGQKDEQENSKPTSVVSDKLTNAKICEPSNGLIEEKTKNQSKKTKKRSRDSESKDNSVSIENCNGNEETEPSSKSKKKKSKHIENNTVEECHSTDVDLNSQVSQGKFSWQKAIKKVLKDAGEDGISIKRLKKKVISEYNAHGTNHQASTKDQCSAVFSQKLLKYKNAKIVKERVFYKK